MSDTEVQGQMIMKKKKETLNFCRGQGQLFEGCS